MVNTLAKKTFELLKKPGNSSSFIDIDPNLSKRDNYISETNLDVTLRNYEAIVNPVKLWLQSRKGDYIRAKDWGGPFQFALNDKFAFTKENETNVSVYLKSELQMRFPELLVVSCKVECNLRDRSWDIDLTLQDTYSKTPVNLVESIEVGDES